MKRLLLCCAIICLLFVSCACKSNTTTEEGGKPKKFEATESSGVSAELELMTDNFPLKKTVQHESLEALLENCATEDIRTVMAGFPVDEFERLYYFNTYYTYDDDYNFPTSVIAFDEGGQTYYFTGAESHNPFADGDNWDDRVYAAKDLANIFITRSDGNIDNGSLTYADYAGDYTLAPVLSVAPDAYFSTLSKAVGAEFRCVNDGTVKIEGGIVYVSRLFGDIDGASYSLSNPDILKELRFSFKKGEFEFVNYSSDPDAPGGDMVKRPDALHIELEAVGIGRTVLTITETGGETLYSVEIEVDEEFGAFLPGSYA